MPRIVSVMGFALLSSTAFAADIPERRIVKPSVTPSDSVYFGSLYVGANLFHVPSQTINLGAGFGAGKIPSVTGGFISGGGKVTYIPAGGAFGGQVDLNLGAINGAWIDPDAGASNRAFGISGALHVFTKLNQNTKVGAFFSGDFVGLKSPGIRADLAGYIGGIEGQYELNPSLLLTGRLGGGVITTSTSLALPAGFKIPNTTVLTGGIGLTYAMQPNWTVGADLNLTRARTGTLGVSGHMTVVDVGLNTEYRFASMPLSLRADVGWFNGGLKINAGGPSPSANGYRAKLTFKYEFGAPPRRLVDREFQSYTILSGMR